MEQIKQKPLNKYNVFVTIEKFHIQNNNTVQACHLKHEDLNIFDFK